MITNLFPQSGPISSVPNRSVGQYNSYVGVNTNRQDRFQARQERRWGDWGYLDVPTPVLWLNDAMVFSPFEEAAVETAVFVDIWAL
jgi:hypothetical protein